MYSRPLQLMAPAVPGPSCTVWTRKASLAWAPGGFATDRRGLARNSQAATVGWASCSARGERGPERRGTGVQAEPTRRRGSRLTEELREPVRRVTEADPLCLHPGLLQHLDVVLALVAERVHPGRHNERRRDSRRVAAERGEERRSGIGGTWDVCANRQGHVVGADDRGVLVLLARCGRREPRGDR